MKCQYLLTGLLVSILSSGCAAAGNSRKESKRPPQRVEVLPVDVTPQGYLIKDQDGQTWLITISPDGRLIIHKVLAR